MKSLAFAGCALLLASTSACTALGNADPAATITALGNAGCSGSLTVGIHAATASGLSPGSASFDNTFTGTCDPSKAKPAAATVTVGATVIPAAPAAAAPSK